MLACTDTSTTHSFDPLIQHTGRKQNVTRLSVDKFWQSLVFD